MEGGRDETNLGRTGRRCGGTHARGRRSRVAHGDDGDDISDHQHFRDQALKDFKGEQGRLRLEHDRRRTQRPGRARVQRRRLGARRARLRRPLGLRRLGDGELTLLPDRRPSRRRGDRRRDPTEPSALRRSRTSTARRRRTSSSTRRGSAALPARTSPSRGSRIVPAARYEPTRNDRGLQLWDVTDAAHPVPLGCSNTAAARGACTSSRCSTGPTSAARSRTRRADVALSGRVDLSGYRDADDGDFRLIDITDPATRSRCRRGDPGHRRSRPARAAMPTRTTGTAPSRPTTASSSSSPTGTAASSARPDGSREPRLHGRTIYPAEADGDAHSSQYDDGRKLLITADEDFCKPRARAPRRASATSGCT